MLNEFLFCEFCLFSWTVIVVLTDYNLRRMADLPDLSHLTPEERAIIENVMMRQKQEEENEKEVMR